MFSSVYPPPRLVFWETTAGCNLACIHCRRTTVADQLLPQDLSRSEAFRLVEQIAELAPAAGQTILVLSGGEPLFRPDIFDIARHAADMGLIVALASNATLIDGEVARRIAASGIRRVSVSFDGADAATHDIFRGTGAYAQALAGIEHLTAAGVPFQINTTVARHNVRQMPETLAMARELAEKALTDGSAWQKFRTLVIAQGGDVRVIDDPDLLPKASLQHTVFAEDAGWVKQAHALIFGETCIDLGAGRQKKGDTLDLAVGIVIHVKVGQKLEKGAPLYTVYANDGARLEQAIKRLKPAVQVADYECQELPLFYGVVQ